MNPFHIYLIVGALLFAIGLAVVITRKNAIMVLMGIELMLNAANVNLVGFSQFDKNLDGQVFAIFVIVLAAAEAAIALAIVLRVIKAFNNSDVDAINTLKG